MSIELKSCPFCGSGTPWTTFDDDQERAGMGCFDCGAQIVRRNMADAMAAWNVRCEQVADGDRIDAQRYRWLRDKANDVAKVIDKVAGEIPYDEGTRTGGYPIYEYRAGEDLDAAIDAAMIAATKEQP